MTSPTTDIDNLMHDLKIDQLEYEWELEIKEKARLWAETEMPKDWDRKDQIMIGIFYKHYINYLFNNYIFKPRKAK